MQIPSIAMIDLRTHSNGIGDGTRAPEVLVGLAAERGLEAITLTDHDAVVGIRAEQAQGQAWRGRVIAGTELGAA